MAGRYCSFSRSLLASARASSLRSPPVVPRLRPPPSPTPRLHRRRSSFAPPRNLGELGCIESFLPFSGIAALPHLTAHLTAQARACWKLSLGKNGKDG